jgi:hypothetical protein
VELVGFGSGFERELCNGACEGVMAEWRAVYQGGNRLTLPK